MLPALALVVLSPQLAAFKEGWWDVRVRYPRFSSRGAVARAANAASAARERKVFRDFIAEAKRDMPEIRANGGQNSYSLDVNPHRTADRPNVCSGYVDRYDYLGGAHGTARFEVLNYAVLRGRAQAFSLKDLFRPGEDAIGQASRALVTVIKADKEAPSLVASGEWTRLTERQSHRFVVGKLGLLFLFNQYDLGAGAEGSRTYLVPYAKLPGLDRNGVLRGLMP